MRVYDLSDDELGAQLRWFQHKDLERPHGHNRARIAVISREIMRRQLHNERHAARIAERAQKAASGNHIQDVRGKDVSGRGRDEVVHELSPSVLDCSMPSRGHKLVDWFSFISPDQERRIVAAELREAY